ncbi:hypothetical protein [Thiomicrorhabdus indica]|uniref:hypothetical protein n=1 Tax=Thiomicrorhabdus indica TaxID=2267253 RepID=UPI002AA71ACE|nr:hypothetical protein [Thiomicrorhabdus indica]
MNTLLLNEITLEVLSTADKAVLKMAKLSKKNGSCCPSQFQEYGLHPEHAWSIMHGIVGKVFQERRWNLGSAFYKEADYLIRETLKKVS